jgi:hypothetical protein
MISVPKSVCHVPVACAGTTGSRSAIPAIIEHCRLRYASSARVLGRAGWRIVILPHLCAANWQTIDYSALEDAVAVPSSGQ